MKYLALLCLASCSGASFVALDDRAPFVEAPDASPDATPDASPDRVTAPDAGSETTIGDVHVPIDAHDASADAGDAPSEVADTGTPDTGCSALTHANGAGQSYEDCAPLGTPGNASTYTASMASEAATAWGIGIPAMGSVREPDGITYDTCIIAPSGTGNPCGIWCYTGVYAGYVHWGTFAAGCSWPGEMNMGTWQ